MGIKKETVEVQGKEREVLRRYGNGGIGYIEDVGTARLGKKKILSPRDRIIGDLKALGMKNTEVASVLKGREPTIGESISVGITAKDPKVMNYIDAQQEEYVAAAKQRLLEAVPRATENFITAIEGGDLVPSTKLLMSVGALDSGKKTTSVEAVEKFGDWLMSQRRQVVVGEKDNDVRQPRKLVTDTREIDDPVAGERITIISEGD